MISCIMCGAELEPAIAEDEHQPYKGLMFISHGNYGSTVFDPMIGSKQFLQVIICDSCIVQAAAKGNVLEGEHRVDHHWDYKPWVPFKEDNP